MKRYAFICILLVSFSNNSIAQSLQFTGHTIYQATTRIFFTATSDLDQDGDQDILFTQPNQEILKWFENQDGGNFILREIGNFPEAFSTWVVDFDSDGDNDILASSYDPSKVILFENDGNQNFTFYQLSTDVPHPLTIAAGDIDHDGDYDIACATQDAGKGMMLLRNDGNMIFTPMDLSTQPYSSTWTQIIDLDQDGDLDILGNNFNLAGGILWYEQTTQLAFIEHLIPMANVHGFTAEDIDGDGDIDLAGVSCGSQLAWFQNDGNNNFNCFILDNQFDCAVSVMAADLDLDGKADIVASAWSDDKVDWWKNIGNGNFTRQSLSDSILRPNCVSVADFNNDGLPDVVSGGYSGTIRWWENSGHGVSSGEPAILDFAEITYDQETGKLKIILSPGIASANAELFDIAGNQITGVFAFTSYASLICDTLKPGIYLLKLKSADRIIIRKIIINQ